MAGQLGRHPERHVRRMLLVGLLFAVVSAFLWPANTGDMNNFLIPWLNTILEQGQVRAFAHPFANYTPPYLYLLAAMSPLASVFPKVTVIKLLSLLGTAGLWVAACRLLRAADRPTEGALWLLLLPTIIANAAAMGQADAFWAAACLMTLASAIERRPFAMLVWFGVAIAFKAQAVFLAPFVGHYLFQQKVRLAFWPAPLLVYVIAMLPAALVGWPILDLLTVYLRQAQWNPVFISNAANPWSLIQYAAPQAGLAWLWIGDLAAIVAAFLLVSQFRRRPANDARWMLGLALLSALLIPYLLPKMHERFFYLADVLAFLVAWVTRDRQFMIVAVLVEGGSLAALTGLLLRQPLFPVAGSAMVGAAILLTLRQVARGRSQPQGGLDQSVTGAILSAA